MGVNVRSKRFDALCVRLRGPFGPSSEAVARVHT